MTYFSEKFAEVSYDSLNKIATIDFKAYMSSEQLRDVYLKSLECAVQNKTSKCLVDSRTYVTMRPEDQKWMNDVMMPKGFQAGLRKIAVIIPENPMQKMAAQNTMSHNGTTVEIQMFGNKTEALAWLKR